MRKPNLIFVAFCFLLNTDADLLYRKPCGVVGGNRFNPSLPRYASYIPDEETAWNQRSGRG